MPVTSYFAKVLCSHVYIAKADIGNMLCSCPMTDPISAGKIRIGKSVKMSSFFIEEPPVGFIIKDGAI